MNHALLNGALVREDEAVVSISDRGFRFGDGAFETIAVRDALPYLWEYHIERLSGGLTALGIACDMPALLPQALQLLKANAVTQGMLRIQVSRGCGSQGYLPVGPSRPTLVMQTLPLPAFAATAATCWLSSFEKTSPRALPTRHKLSQALGSVLARMEAAEHGCSEGLQLAQGGWVCEASSANIFWRREGRVYTPSLESGALAGVTRRRVLELLPSRASEGLYDLAHLLAADEVILTNASAGAIPVAGLHPHGKTWESAPFANEINALIKQDIISHFAHFKRMLART